MISDRVWNGDRYPVDAHGRYEIQFLPAKNKSACQWMTRKHLRTRCKLREERAVGKLDSKTVYKVETCFEAAGPSLFRPSDCPWPKERSFCYSFPYRLLRNNPFFRGLFWCHHRGSFLPISFAMDASMTVTMDLTIALFQQAMCQFCIVPSRFPVYYDMTQEDNAAVSVSFDTPERPTPSSSVHVWTYLYSPQRPSIPIESQHLKHGISSDEDGLHVPPARST